MRDESYDRDEKPKPSINEPRFGDAQASNWDYLNHECDHGRRVQPDHSQMESGRMMN